MAALHPLPTRLAGANVHPESGHVRRADDLGLVLRFDPAMADRPPAAGAVVRQGRLELLVHVLRDRPVRLRAIRSTRLAAGPCGMALRRPLGKRGGLTLPRPSGQRQCFPQLIPFAAQPLVRSLEPFLVPLQPSLVLLQPSLLAAESSERLLKALKPLPRVRSGPAHPAHDTGRRKFCPAKSAADPLNNYCVGLIRL